MGMKMWMKVSSHFMHQSNPQRSLNSAILLFLGLTRCLTLNRNYLFVYICEELDRLRSLGNITEEKEETSPQDLAGMDRVSVALIIKK